MTFDVAKNLKLMRKRVLLSIADAERMPQYATWMSVMMSVSDAKHERGRSSAWTKYTLYTGGSSSKKWPQLNAALAPLLKSTVMAVPVRVEIPDCTGNKLAHTSLEEHEARQQTLSTMQGNPSYLVLLVQVASQMFGTNQRAGTILQYLLFENKRDAMRFKLAHL